jgi:hypothetical protein
MTISYFNSDSHIINFTNNKLSQLKKMIENSNMYDLIRLRLAVPLLLLSVLPSMLRVPPDMITVPLLILVVPLLTLLDVDASTKSLISSSIDLASENLIDSHKYSKQI